MAAKTNRDRDAYVAHLLAGGSSVSAAAKLSGLSRATIARRMHDDEFRELLRNEVALLVEAGRRHLLADAASVRGVLAKIANDDEERAMPRIAAIRAILEYGLKYTELADVKVRLESLEDQWREFKNDL